ncbi:MAG: hypothetical protein ACREX0_13000 [Noviherbaspirillum sp.]
MATLWLFTEQVQPDNKGLSHEEHKGDSSVGGRAFFLFFGVNPLKQG